MCEEIRAGRWRLGEQLPPMARLAEETGLGYSPLRRAFARLEAEGYIRQQQGAGSFLLSVEPRADEEKAGVLGIAALLRETSSAWESEPNVAPRLSSLLEEAARRGWRTEVKLLPEGFDWRAVAKRGKAFSPEVTAMVSLHPFPHATVEDLTLGADDLPFVYWGTESGECLPVVAGDTENGFYQITRYILGRGHRQTVAILDQEETLSETARRLAGYERALRDAGPRADSQAAWKTLDLRASDLRGVQAFLEAPREATAFVCVSYPMAQSLIAVADVLGLRVPEDFSVTGHGRGVAMRPHDRTRRLVSLDYDRGVLIERCFDLLAEQRTTGRVRVSRVLVHPTVTQGESAGPPSPARGLAGSLSLADGIDPGNL